MAAGIKDFIVEQGASWDAKVLWKDEAGDPVDVSIYSARMQVRRSIVADEVIVELTSEPDGGITLALVEVGGEPAYNVLLELDGAETAALPATPASKKWYYDLELFVTADPDDVRRLLQGRFEVSLEVTR